jgi:PIN domain nuclease of toxin-antitoxin system
MRVLLDTHMLLWLLNNPDLLPHKADQIIFDPNNIVFISSISFWEIAIKTAIGKLKLETSLEDLESICENSNLILIAFHGNHALEVAKLPDHHKDPFDRALIAQAKLEQMKLLTHDTLLPQYGDVVSIV